MRRFISAPYHLDYTFVEDVIFIVAIRHGRQSLQELETDEDSESGDPETGKNISFKSTIYAGRRA